MSRVASSLAVFAVLLLGCSPAVPIVEHASWDGVGQAAAPLGPPRAVELVRVIDGDTIVVTSEQKQLTVRLLGIDCPESHRNAKCTKEGQAGGETCDVQIPKGLVAAGEMRQRLHGALALEEVRGPDLYGRTLAYVRVAPSPGDPGGDVGLSLVADGFCHEFARYPHPRRVTYQAAEAAWRRQHP